MNEYEEKLLLQQATWLRPLDRSRSTTSTRPRMRLRLPRPSPRGCISSEDAEHTIGRAVTRAPTLHRNIVYVAGENLKFRP